MGFPGGSDGKASACNMGDPGLIPGSGRFPWSRKWQPTPVLLPRKFHGWKEIFWGVLVLEGLVGLHRTVQLQLLQYYWSGHRFGLL